LANSRSENREFVAHRYPELLQNRDIIQGTKCKHFARHVDDLPPNVAEQDHNYTHIILPAECGLSSGKWFVDVKLDNVDKQKVLSKMSKHAGLVKGTHWSWHNDGKKKDHPFRSSADIGI
jgi:hypothetical protein